MRRTLVGGATAAVVLAAVLPIAVATPAQAGVFGLDLKIASYDWTPRTGDVTVTARAECPKRMWRAEFEIALEQRRTDASGRKKLPCDGDTHTIRLTLDPKQGRFHPGAATMQLTTLECVSDVCAGLIYPEREVRIPPPGRGHRGAR